MAVCQVLTAEPDYPGIGRGVPSGRGGLWREWVLTDALPCIVFYADGVPTPVTTIEGWCALPDDGLQVVVTGGGKVKGADAYQLGGVRKLGLYLDDEAFERIYVNACALAEAQGRAQRGIRWRI